MVIPATLNGKYTAKSINEMQRALGVKLKIQEKGSRKIRLEFLVLEKRKENQTCPSRPLF